MSPYLGNRVFFNLWKLSFKRLGHQPVVAKLRFLEGSQQVLQSFARTIKRLRSSVNHAERPHGARCVYGETPKLS